MGKGLWENFKEKRAPETVIKEFEALGFEPENLKQSNRLVGQITENKLRIFFVLGDNHITYIVETKKRSIL